MLSCVLQFNVQRSLEHHQQQPSSSASSLPPSIDAYHPHHSSHHSSAGSVSSGGGGVGSPGSPPVSVLRHKEEEAAAGGSSGEGTQVAAAAGWRCSRLFGLSAVVVKWKTEGPKCLVCKVCNCYQAHRLGLCLALLQPQERIAEFSITVRGAEAQGLAFTLSLPCDSFLWQHHDCLLLNL
jgi:hypothetical protein